ncbi:hypothetical protein D3C77_465820 [compost metagenome]
MDNVINLHRREQFRNPIGSDSRKLSRLGWCAKNNRTYRIDSDDFRLRVSFPDFARDAENTACCTNSTYEIIYGPVHLFYNFLACAIIVCFPVQWIRILIDPIRLRIVLNKLLHSINSCKQITSVLIRLLHHINLCAKILNESQIA